MQFSLKKQLLSLKSIRAGAIFKELLVKAGPKKAWGWGLGYLLLILFFAFIYWNAWKDNPDSFIVNTELNLQPLRMINKAAWTAKGITHMAFDDIDFIPTTENLNDVYRLAVKYGKEAQELDSKLRKYERDKYLIDDKISEVRQAILYQLRSDIRRRITLMKKELEREESKMMADYEISVTSKHSTDSEIYREHLKIYKHIFARSIEEYRKIATEEVEAERNMELSSPKLQALINEKKELISKISSLERPISEVKGNIRSLYKNWRDQRQSLLDISDFIYYSIGISTTTTFGDIIANNRTIRMVVSIQLVLSVFVLGGFVNSVRRT